MRRETGDSSFHVTYLVRAAAADVAARAESLLLEQTVELPRAIAARDPWVAAHILGCVEEIRPAGVDLHRVTIAQPLATTAGDPAQLLSVLFGNCSLQPDVLLADVELPDAAFDWLPGPRAGVAGLRELTGVSGRPLLATALKPMGLKPAQLAALCAHLRAGGHRSDQGRSRPRRSSVLPVRGARRGVPRARWRPRRARPAGARSTCPI